MQLKKFGLLGILREKLRNRNTRGKEDSTFISKSLEPLVMEIFRRQESIIINPERDRQLMERFRLNESIKKRQNLIKLLEREIECQES